MENNTLTIASLDREFTALIDRHHVYGAESIINALVRATKGHPYLTKDDVFMLFYKAYQREADKVKQGYWIDIHPDDLLDVRMKCSACGVTDTPLGKWRYCPSCGCRMIGQMEGAENMTLNELLTMGTVTDNTQIILKIGEGPVERRITGYWYEDKILSMTSHPVITFVWQSNGVLIANLAGEPRDEHTERLSRQATAILIKQYMQFEGR